jgi:hypothetical protein
MVAITIAKTTCRSSTLQGYAITIDAPTTSPRASTLDPPLIGGTDKFCLSLLGWSLSMMHVIDAVLDFRRSLATHNAIRAGGGEVIPT